MLGNVHASINLNLTTTCEITTHFGQKQPELQALNKLPEVQARK